MPHNNKNSGKRTDKWKEKGKGILSQMAGAIGQQVQEGKKEIHEFLEQRELKGIIERYRHKFGDEFDSIQAKVAGKLKREDEDLKEKTHNKAARNEFLQRRAKEMMEEEAQKKKY